ncbi:hypothetical protein N7G274_002069 [Stereocaulon virgatum]|uniref:Uncharacterized protein n=1 Tax=Stereocaulon virgatum TaxID=373712 RepID=A0ABR4AJG3_9LECA
MPWNPIVSETSASNVNKYTTGTVLGSVFGGIFCGLILAFLFVETFYYFRHRAERSKGSGSGKRVIDEVLEHRARVPVPMSLTESSAANVRSPSIPPISRPVSRLIVTNPTIELEEAPMPVSYDVNATANVHPHANASVIGTRSSNSRTGPQEHPLPERVPQPQTDFQGFFRGNRFTEAAGAQTRVLLEKVKRRSGPPA